MHEGHDVAVLTIGPIGNVAAEAVAEVEAEGQLTVAHYDMRYLKPIDGGILDEVGQRFSRVITVEERDVLVVAREQSCQMGTYGIGTGNNDFHPLIC